MSLVFIEMEYEAHSRAVQSVDELMRLIATLRAERASCICKLISAEGALTIGIRGGFGCVQYSKPDGNPPYQVVLADEPLTHEDVEFMCGGTLTPIPARNIISAAMTDQLVRAFWEDASVPTGVDVEEV